MTNCIYIVVVVDTGERNCMFNVPTIPYPEMLLTNYTNSSSINIPIQLSIFHRRSIQFPSFSNVLSSEGGLHGSICYAYPEILGHLNVCVDICKNTLSDLSKFTFLITWCITSN